MPSNARNAWLSSTQPPAPAPVAVDLSPFKAIVKPQGRKPLQDFLQWQTRTLAEGSGSLKLTAGEKSLKIYYTPETGFCAVNHHGQSIAPDEGANVMQWVQGELGVKNLFALVDYH